MNENLSCVLLSTGIEIFVYNFKRNKCQSIHILAFSFGKMSQFSLGHLLLGNDPKQNFPQGCSEECTRLPKHNGNCQLAPPVHSHLPLNSGCGKDQNISLVPLEIRFYHLDALLWNLESGKEMEHLRTESGKEMEHHRKVSCSNRSEDSSSWLLRGNKSHHRGSSLAISSFGW